MQIVIVTTSKYLAANEVEQRIPKAPAPNPLVFYDYNNSSKVTSHMAVFSESSCISVLSNNI